MTHTRRALLADFAEEGLAVASVLGSARRGRLKDFAEEGLAVASVASLAQPITGEAQPRRYWGQSDSPIRVVRLPKLCRPRRKSGSALTVF